ncbi:hypothetical protein FACS189437_07210 [Bacteroidia bacterium]|nr:hypothetical protein FACS189437_07210 [Bacteroidia bacterium]
MDNSIYRVRWNTLVKITTVIVSIILLFVEWEVVNSLIHSNNILLCVILLSVINFMIIITILNVPLYLKLTEDAIILKKIGGSIKIEYNEIQFIQTHNAYPDMRLFGSGGFFGYIGIFSNDKQGWYNSYVENPKQSFLITTNKNKKYVFSSENREDIINKVKQQIK